ncbi:hypothetical protein C7E17_20540, partial [Stenotrophomonas maltophilia]
GGDIVQDDPIDGQRQTWSVALPETAAREVLAGDFLTLDQARTEAERTGGDIVQDDPIDGQRQTWSVALPETAAREVLAGDILFQPTRTDEVPTGLAPETPVR